MFFQNLQRDEVDVNCTLGPDDNARAQQLVECGCKVPNLIVTIIAKVTQVIVVDSSHGSCAPAKEKISFIKKNVKTSTSKTVRSVLPTKN